MSQVQVYWLWRRVMLRQETNVSEDPAGFLPQHHMVS
jgi:hypothetical protein